jgi:hypothetical protein
MLVPDETPFTTFLTVALARSTAYPEFKALEDDVLPRFDAVVGAGGTAVTFNVATGTKFNKNDIVIATRTGEQMIVVLRRRQRPHGHPWRHAGGADRRRRAAARRARLSRRAI